MRVFRFFESLLEPTGLPPGPPPDGLGAFYWHHARQARGLVIALFAAGLLVALLDTTIPVFVGRVVTMVSKDTPYSVLHDSWRQLFGMALVLMVARPLAMLLQSLITNQAIIPSFSNLVRWQSHWHVVRQSWTFFQNDYAGRIANRVMQTGPAMRESVVSATNAVWYILVYGGGAIVLLASSDTRLAIPVLVWFCGYAALLQWFVPRLRNRSQRMSAARSQLTGRVVDSYTNIQTVKLFARARDEDAFVSDAMDEMTEAHRYQLRLTTTLGLSLALLNAAMVVGTGGVAIWQWSIGRIAVGTVAMALPLTWHIASIAGWVAQNVATIFENIGVVQEGMRSIAVPHQMTDRPNAVPLQVGRG
ncbi:MAG TPA: ABC transporter transmembrane domain-containing protein, partial [Stellaceae bacterium]